MADDNRWSDRDRDWRDDRNTTEPGMGRDGRWHDRPDQRAYGDGGRDSPGYNPGGPAQGGYRRGGDDDRGYGARDPGQGGAPRRDEQPYRDAARSYQEGDPGYPVRGGRGYRGGQGSGGYSEARFGPTEGYGRDQGGYSRGREDYDYGPYTPYGGVTEGETSSDYRRPAPQAWRGDGAERGGEHRSWMERTGEKLGHFVRDLTPGEHHGRGPKGYKRSDERIREDISDRLTEDGYLDASNIDVAVDGGEVTLSGTVSDRQSKRRAEDLADAVSGVTHVQNNLRASGGSGTVPETEAIIDGAGVVPEA